MDRIGSGRRLEPETDGFLFLRVKAIKLNELNEGMKTDNSLTHPPRTARYSNPSLSLFHPSRHEFPQFLTL